ncbi:hypothetical protein ANO11243_010580 [Dothideomycetidae sp. 11243]|nr:hypothetical protein ANO11243_010580 [fungal sp. No.11243]
MSRSYPSTRTTPPVVTVRDETALLKEEVCMSAPVGRPSIPRMSPAIQYEKVRRFCLAGLVACDMEQALTDRGAGRVVRRR